MQSDSPGYSQYIIIELFQILILLSIFHMHCVTDGEIGTQLNLSSGRQIRGQGGVGEYTSNHRYCLIFLIFNIHLFCEV